jgi:hypothetical protein
MKNLLDLNKLKDRLKADGLAAGGPGGPGGPPRRVQQSIHWSAIHVACGQEAFCYYDPYHRPDKTLVGAKVYRRGERAFEITEKFIEENALRCVHCGLIIKKEDEVKPAPEILTIKSMMRFLENLGGFHEGMNLYTQRHLRILEYLPLMGIALENWETVDNGLEQQIASLRKFIEGFYSNCVGIGQCSEPKNPSEIILARNLDGVEPPPGGNPAA